MTEISEEVLSTPAQLADCCRYLAGCPVIGDRLYGKAAPGQQLHLQSHAIVLPLSKNKPPVRVEAPPPAHMLKALEACGYLPPGARHSSGAIHRHAKTRHWSGAPPAKDRFTIKT